METTESTVNAPVAKSATQKEVTNFDFAKWLKERSEKPSTKTVSFQDLTKVEKIETLLSLLGKSEMDVEKDIIKGTEERAFGECSAQARAAVLTEVIEKLKKGENVDMPKDKDIVCVPIKTSFAAASMNAQINYLSGLYGKAVSTVTIQLPCGEAWVKGLIEHCRAMEAAETAEK